MLYLAAYEKTLYHMSLYTRLILFKGHHSLDVEDSKPLTVQVGQVCSAAVSLYAFQINVACG